MVDPEFESNHDVSFNAFNIDMVYPLVFSPASEFSIVWKNTIMDEQADSEDDYFNTFNKVNTAPVENSISFRCTTLITS